MARGGRFAYDVPPMPVLVYVGPARGERIVALMGLELPGTSYANIDQLNTQIVAFAHAVLSATGVDVRIVPDSESAADLKVSHDSLNADPKWSKDPAGGYNAATTAAHVAIKAAGKLGDFWYDELDPFLVEWQNFHKSHSHWYDAVSQAATGSEVYQSWQSRLDALRKKAASLNVKLPADQAPIAKSTGIADVVGDVGRKLLIGAGVIGGIVAVVELAKR